MARQEILLGSDFLIVLWILGVILLFVLLVALLRVGVQAEYSDAGICVQAKVGPVFITVFPRPPKKEKKPKKPKAKKEKKRKGETDEAPPEKKKAKKGGNLELVLAVLGEVGELLSRFRHKLCVNVLTVYYTAAADDPYAAAMQFGEVSAGMGALVPLLENAFRIRDRDFQANVDFMAEKPVVYLNLRLSIAIWEIIYVVSGVVWTLLIQLLKAKTRKSDKKTAPEQDKTAKAQKEAAEQEKTAIKA